MDAAKTTGCRKYLDWALSPTGGVEPPTFLRNHLAECESCARDRESAESDGTGLESLFREAASVEPPSDFAPALLSSLPTPAWRLRDPKTRPPANGARGPKDVPLGPGVRSATRNVPAVVPSLRHSSAPASS